MTCELLTKAASPLSADGTRDADLYAELTGRPVSGAAMQMHRMRWSLDDIALAVATSGARMSRPRTPG